MRRRKKDRRSNFVSEPEVREANQRDRQPGGWGRSGYDLTSAAKDCDRCGLSFAEGYTWPGLGMPLVLCKDCADDIEESVESYGESRERRHMRLMDRLRAIGT